MLLTVTLNPALDRTMTVPNFQAGFRHRATDTVMLRITRFYGAA